MTDIHVPFADLANGPRDADRWRSVQLGDVIESMKNGIYKPASSYIDDGIPCLRMYNIDDGHIVWRDIRRMRLTAGERADYELTCGDLLVNRVNSRELVGKTAVIPANIEPSVFESKNIRIRLRRDLASPEFVNYWLLLNGREYFGANAQQVVGMASISQAQIARFPMLLPPVSQQLRIVAEIEKHFTRLKSGSQGLSRANSNLRRYRAAVLLAAAEGRLLDTATRMAVSRRGPTTESTKELLDQIATDRHQNWGGPGKYGAAIAPEQSELPPLPKNWEWVTLDQLRVFLRNGIAAKPDAEDGVPILRISAVRPMSINLDDVRYLAGASDDYAGYLLGEGDLLFTRYNGNPDLVGVCGVVPGIHSAIAHPDKLIRCKLSGLVEPRFVAIAANVGVSRAYLARRVRTTAGQAGISGGDLKGLPIPLPPRAEQQRIVAEVEHRLSVAAQLEASVGADVQRANRLRQSILQKAFSGQLI